MGRVQIQELVKNVEKEKGSQRGLSPCSFTFTWVCCPVNVSRAGGWLLCGSSDTALFLALMPAIQASQEIGLGNSLKVITWDSGNSRCLLRAAPKCSRRCILSCSLSGLSLLFMFISGWSQSWYIHELSLSVFFFLFFFFFKPILFFHCERKKLAAPQSHLSHP